MSTSFAFPFIHFERHRNSGATLVIGPPERPTAVTPLAETWRVGVGNVQLRWHRPTAVRVEEDGSQREIPIVDSTRRLQLLAALLIGLNVVYAVLRHDFGKSQGIHHE